MIVSSAEITNGFIQKNTAGMGHNLMEIML